MTKRNSTQNSTQVLDYNNLDKLDKDGLTRASNTSIASEALAKASVSVALSTVRALNILNVLRDDGDWVAIVVEDTILNDRGNFASRKLDQDFVEVVLTILSNHIDVREVQDDTRGIRDGGREGVRDETTVSETVQSTNEVILVGSGEGTLGGASVTSGIVLNLLTVDDLSPVNINTIITRAVGRILDGDENTDVSRQVGKGVNTRRLDTSSQIRRRVSVQADIITRGNIVKNKNKVRGASSTINGRDAVVQLGVTVEEGHLNHRGTSSSVARVGRVAPERSLETNVRRGRLVGDESDEESVLQVEVFTKGEFLVLGSDLDVSNSHTGDVLKSQLHGALGVGTPRGSVILREDGLGGGGSEISCSVNISKANTQLGGSRVISVDLEILVGTKEAHTFRVELRISRRHSKDVLVELREKGNLQLLDLTRDLAVAVSQGIITRWATACNMEQQKSKIPK